ncbi:meiotically up-regulated gene 113-domain-containing protein [Dendryphion nanum]|uniref:Meiotically up-regulated gene 113-domain-containing protein n=1 Tax=Dendryphion nanum TaxID=256645 RepID=A0A9P9IJE1_9PLEO|nr:meiotically up-regulated gene 113-domain-containing protein [Dendryphion nanum]
MAFTGQTPEALLARSDSKNPATTCKGITKMGRACRNPLDLKNASGDNGVLAVASVVGDSDDDEEEEIGAAAFFCWRHKDQAEAFAASANENAATGRETQIFPLQNRTSIDTLVQRLGVLDIDESTPEVRQKKRRERGSQGGNGGGSSRPRRRVHRPPTWDQVQGPLMSVPSDIMKQQRPLQPSRPRQKKNKPSFWSSLCCGSADDDYTEVVRHKRRNERPSQQTTEYILEKPMQQPPRAAQTPNIRPSKSSPSSRPSPSAAPITTTATATIPARKPLSSKPIRPLNKISRNEDSETSILIAGPAPQTTASSLLTPPRPDQARRTSEILRQYSVRSPQPNAASRARRRSSAAAPNPTTEEKKTILLKIGRANNVHRRMNEWTRQCGYSLSLVRFYPYVPSGTTPQPSPSPSPHASPATSHRTSAQRPSEIRRASSGVRKVPHAHRVERLIHIELAGKNVRRECEACGKEHREWFEVEASREGVGGVDEVVRRWVEWAERMGNREGE